jgi:hypothetical protein
MVGNHENCFVVVVGESELVVVTHWHSPYSKGDFVWSYEKQQLLLSGRSKLRNFSLIPLFIFELCQMFWPPGTICQMPRWRGCSLYLGLYKAPKVYPSTEYSRVIMEIEEHIEPLKTRCAKRISIINSFLLVWSALSLQPRLIKIGLKLWCE